AGPAWTGTWSVSPQAGGTTFAAQTLPQIVHTSIAGTTARIQLSNAFRNQTVQVAHVPVALPPPGSSLPAPSHPTGPFRRQGSVAIPAGGLAVSDPAAFSVPALSDVAVSFYLPQPTGPATFHQQGTQTNYIASGDVAGNASLGNPQTTGSYYLLANLDVQNP